jgi:TolA-binding protein
MSHVSTATVDKTYMRQSLHLLLILNFIVLVLPSNAEDPAENPVVMVDPLTPLELEQANLAFDLANSLAKEKKYREALQSYEEFIRIFPQSPKLREARESMARIYERRQRYDRAIDQYETLYRELGVSPLGLAYHLEAARLNELSGNENEAVRIYKELNQIDPGSEAAQKARRRMEALNLMQKTGDYPQSTTETQTPADQLVKSSPQKE